MKPVLPWCLQGCAISGTEDISPRMLNLLLLPGFMCDDDLWRDIKPGLEKLGHVGTCAFGDGTTLSEIAEHVLTTAPDQFVLGGFSMGGYVAQEIVYKAPDRVQGLVLIATSACGDTSRKSRRKKDLAAITRTSTFRGLSTAACQSSLHPDHANNEGLILRIQAMALRMGKDAFIQQLCVSRQDNFERLKSFECPALVIGARQDQLRPPEDSEMLASHMPEATLSIIEECGHMIPMEMPELLLNTIVQWLEEKLLNGEYLNV
jgi:pimeloyl-ACP methyl ester carboxylesterase